MVVKVQPYIKTDDPIGFDFYKITSDWITYEKGNLILKILKDNGIEVEIR